ncbi:hypothetical protein FH972_007049 [Carpinus fangiana]|uniref:Uncharacterized protein n=1 Tax=Carpinus fangiana TaxID=176857 RepID=A0A5N6QV65_9ROSI|nr:hypothetical protein FH972_007049 [Carpinus fangiana]
MAASSELSGAHQPFRSISLPSRTHPSSVRLEEVLNTLKSCQISSVSTAFPVGAETIHQTGLVGLAELYNCLEELIHSPLSQQALLRHEHRNLVEEVLDGSITLLDTCGTARDIIFTMKEHVQTLQSALRRKGVDSRIESDIHAYMVFRKKVKKDVAKCLKELKRTERKVPSSPLLDLDPRLSMVIGVLREASAITMSIFRSLLLFLSVPAMETNAARWSSLVSRLMPAKARLLSCEKGQKIINEVGSVDVALCSLHEHLRNTDAKTEVQLAQRTLETLHLSINNVEDGLDYLFSSVGDAYGKQICLDSYSLINKTVRNSMVLLVETTQTGHIFVGEAAAIFYFENGGLCGIRGGKMGDDSSCFLDQKHPK